MSAIHDAGSDLVGDDQHLGDVALETISETRAQWSKFGLFEQNQK